MELDEKMKCEDNCEGFNIEHCLKKNQELKLGLRFREQFVHSVVKFSTEYLWDRWSHKQIIGAPRVYPQTQDSPFAWAPFRPSGTSEFLELAFVDEMLITNVSVYETFTPGSIVKISALVDDEWVPIWKGNPDRTLAEARIFSPRLENYVFSRIIRLDLDCTSSNSWSEVDAVHMKGFIPQDDYFLHQKILKSNMDLQKLLPQAWKSLFPKLSECSDPGIVYFLSNFYFPTNAQVDSLRIIVENLEWDVLDKILEVYDIFQGNFSIENISKILPVGFKDTLESLLEGNILSDFEIHCSDGVILHAHSVILNHVCKAFQGHELESKNNSDDWKRFLRFCYLNEVPTPFSDGFLILFREYIEEEEEVKKLEKKFIKSSVQDFWGSLRIALRSQFALKPFMKILEENLVSYQPIILQKIPEEELQKILFLHYPMLKIGLDENQLFTEQWVSKIWHSSKNIWNCSPSLVCGPPKNEGWKTTSDHPILEIEFQRPCFLVNLKVHFSGQLLKIDVMDPLGNYKEIYKNESDANVKDRVLPLRFATLPFVSKRFKLLFQKNVCVKAVRMCGFEPILVEKEFTKDYFDMVKNGMLQELSDCEFVVGTDKYPLHKGFLKHRCPSLLKFIENGNCIFEDKVTFTTMKIFLTMLYSDQFDPGEFIQNDDAFSNLVQELTYLHELFPTKWLAKRIELMTATGMKMMLLLDESLPSTFERDLYSLYNDPSTKDMVFKVTDSDGKRCDILADAFVCATRCPIFAAILTRWRKEKQSKIEIIVEDLSIEVFRTILEFIYCNNAPVDHENALDVLIGSAKYLLHEKFQKPYEIVQSSICKENVFDLIRIGHNFSLKKLYEIVCDYLITNAQDTWKGILELYKSVDKEFQETILERSELKSIVQDGFIPTTQWVKECIECSSEYGHSWSHTNIVGPSNTFPKYGDFQTAWAPRTSRGSFEHLVFSFAKHVIPLSLRIYETYNPGAVVKISCFNKGNDSKNSWDILYEGPPHQNEIPMESRIFAPTLAKVDFFTDLFRIDLDTNLSVSWSEIDAIQVFGLVKNVET